MSSSEEYILQRKNIAPKSQQHIILAPQTYPWRPWLQNYLSKNFGKIWYYFRRTSHLPWKFPWREVDGWKISHSLHQAPGNLLSYKKICNRPGLTVMAEAASGTSAAIWKARSLTLQMIYFIRIDLKISQAIELPIFLHSNFWQCLAHTNFECFLGNLLTWEPVCVVY